MPATVVMAASVIGLKRDTQAAIIVVRFNIPAAVRRSISPIITIAFLRSIPISPINPNSDIKLNGKLVISSAPRTPKGKRGRQLQAMRV